MSIRVGSKVRVLDPPVPTPPLRIRGSATVVGFSPYGVIVDTVDGRRICVHRALVRGLREPNGTVVIPHGEVCSIERLPPEYVVEHR